MHRLSSNSPLVKLIHGTVAALPAYNQAIADTPPAFTEVGLRYSRYSEDSLSGRALIFGATDRYDIDITQFWIEAPLGSNWSVALDIQNDYQSGASPWFVGAQADGSPGVIMSGASIRDNRVEVTVNTRYFWADGNAGFAVTQSDEDDYEALAVSADVSWNSADNQRTWTASYSQSNDTVEPTQGVVPVFVDREELETQSGHFGVSQILSKTAIVRLGLSFTLSDGYLSDPYKFFDARPDRHERFSASVGYRRFFIEADGALQADYSYYSDSWGTDSHAVELAWRQNFRKARLTPYLRYYTQGAADFFSVIADPSQPQFADDYRLSAFGAVTAGLRGEYQLGEWLLEAQLERYESDHGWGLYSGESAPALVDFWRATVGVNWRFD